MFSQFLQKLDTGLITYFLDQNIVSYNSFKLNCYVKVLVIPNTIEELCYVLRELNHFSIKYFILCNGTNTIFVNEWYNGVVISTHNLNKVQVYNNYIDAECGALVTRLAILARENSLTGMEFCYGIPGGIGGAVYMNASAFGREISDIVSRTVYYDIKNDSIQAIDCLEHNFEKKSSIFQKREFVILKTILSLKKGSCSEINQLMNEYISKRKLTQPLDFPSAGSIFKRPADGYASMLIDKAGLKGARVGGAEVSKKHAGFIINTGDACGADIKKLIEQIKCRVFGLYKIKLENEVILVE